MNLEISWLVEQVIEELFALGRGDWSHHDRSARKRRKLTIGTRLMRAEPSCNLGREPWSSRIAVHAELAVDKRSV
jgi:hypothetical protein